MKQKLKNSKSALKRIKIKKNCLERKKAYKAHLLRRKNSNRLRRLSRLENIQKSDLFNFHFLIPYR